MSETVRGYKSIWNTYQELKESYEANDGHNMRNGCLDGSELGTAAVKDGSEEQGDEE